MNVRRSTRTARAAAVALALPLVLAVSPSSSAQAAAAPAVGAYSDAYGILVDTTLLDSNVPLTVGPEASVANSCLPNAPTKTNQLLGVGDAAAARADVMQTSASADCTAKSSTSSARVVNVDALGAVAQLKIHADLITATSTTSCSKAPKGSTQVVNLSIGGTPIPVPSDIPPNTEVASALLNVLGLKLVLNEQHPAASGRGLVVNALHLIGSAEGATIPVGGRGLRGDVVISHAVSSVVCPGGPGSETGGLPKPDISFDKAASVKSAKAGDTVVYTAVVTNTSAKACEVLRFTDHIAAPFALVSSAGAFGTKVASSSRSDGGTDATLHPTGVKIAPGKSVTQTFTVTVKDDAKPGTYYDTLEIYCGINGNFISGPLAPVTIGGPAVIITPEKPVDGPKLAATGGAPLAATVALLVLAAAAGARRLQLRG